jgi:hypothetical protein
MTRLRSSLMMWKATNMRGRMALLADYLAQNGCSGDLHVRYRRQSFTCAD